MLPLPSERRRAPEGAEARPGAQARRAARLLELPQDERSGGPAASRAEPFPGRYQDDVRLDGALAREPARFPEQHEDAPVLLPRELRGRLGSPAHGYDDRRRHGLSLREVGEGAALARRRGGRRGARPAALRERGLPGLSHFRGGGRASRDGRLEPARAEPDRTLPEGDA